MAQENPRKHEVQFCAEVSKWSDRLFEERTTLPFGSSDIESFGRGSNKRQDLRIYARKDRGRGVLALCGEVKLPGTSQGRSPFDVSLMQDAFDKATQENCRFFFTWNVEELALFDRSLWDSETMHERCIGQWKLGLELNKPSDVTRAEVSLRIRNELLPRFFSDFADIWLGRRKDFNEAIPDFYINVLESLLTGPMGPVRELRDYLGVQSEASKAFDSRLRGWMIEQQWSFDRNDPQSWRDAIDRAARSMVYVLNNRILFYQAVRLRNDLPELHLPKSANTAEKALKYFRNSFHQAVEATGDYEPVFFPDNDEEWAALTAFSGTNSLEAWEKLVRAVDRLNFKEIPTDILGHIFQKLISPEERHKFGQHYTEETIVDVINAFCIRKGDANVIDPACGSGSFLVRAYYRKWQLDKTLQNHELLAGLYGADINAFPAHLATLNLASRNLKNEENYPRIVRRNFFTVKNGKAFCILPKAIRDGNGKREREEIFLPSLDAVVGNPPYVRYQEIPKKRDKGAVKDQTREYLREMAKQAWPNLELPGQSDLHVYFWPVAAQFLAEKGWFGFLTSSSWLDARYGFALQRWILQNFKLIAVIESVDEPWFEDARVKTAATILQRCSDQATRDQNLVRFVRLNRPLAEILGSRQDESQKQQGAESLRSLILNAKADKSTDQLRIMTVRQSALWDSGVDAGRMFAKQKALKTAPDPETADEEAGEPDEESLEDAMQSGAYAAGKWGKYLRAPEFYFELQRQYGSRFTRVGEIASIKYGILSGCDDFFMPRDVSADLLRKHPSDMEWLTLPLMKRCKRAEVESKTVAIIKAGDGTLHPIERAYIRPELHSLMAVDRPVVTPEQLDRVVLWVNQQLSELKGTYAHHYITWGSKQTFASKKSRSVPVPERPGCAGRPLWYDLTGRKPGIGFWPMTQKYRHIIPWNPNDLCCNHRLFDIHPLELKDYEQGALMGILNSTLVGLVKHFYGRYAGSEGTLDTEIVDVLMLEIPSPVGAQKELCDRITGALLKISERAVTHLVEQDFLDCHSVEAMRELQEREVPLPLELQRDDRRQLDLLIYELLGVENENERERLTDELYRVTARYYRELRIQDIQSSVNRAGGGGAREASANDLALDAWQQMEPGLRQNIPDWLAATVVDGKIVEIPDGQVRLPAASNLFEATTVYFGKKPAVSYICDTRAEAELITMIASTGVHGPNTLPRSEVECEKLLIATRERLEEGTEKIKQFAMERAGTEKLREQVISILIGWFTRGFPTT
jgi:hypothetical protein